MISGFRVGAGDAGEVDENVNKMLEGPLNVAPIMMMDTWCGSLGRKSSR